MQALLINAASQTIETIDITGLDDIVTQVGFASLESDTVGTDGDRLYFDEECFLRGSAGRFQIDKLIPVAGKGVIIGSAADGTFRDVAIDAEALRGRIKYI